MLWCAAVSELELGSRCKKMWLDLRSWSMLLSTTYQVHATGSSDHDRHISFHRIDAVENQKLAIYCIDAVDVASITIDS